MCYNKVTIAATILLLHSMYSIHFGLGYNTCLSGADPDLASIMQDRFIISKHTLILN